MKTKIVYDLYGATRQGQEAGELIREGMNSEEARKYRRKMKKWLAKKFVGVWLYGREVPSDD